jgi:NADH-ubiquinone oxidoreductase chain 4
MLLVSEESAEVLTLLTLLLLLAFGARRLLGFYVAFEAALLPTAFLVLTMGYQPERLQATTYLVLYTVGARLPLLLRLVGCYLFNGHSSLLLPLWGLPSGVGGAGVWAALMLTAFLAKAPLYGLHLWLPKAHVEAPAVGSIVLAGTLLKLGTYGLVRVLALFPALGFRSGPLLVAVAG